MQLTEITAFIQTLLPLIHGEKDWCAWFSDQTDSLHLTSNHQRPQSLEERILVKHLSTQLTPPFISITTSHLCFQFIEESSNKINQLYCIQTESFELVIAGKAATEQQIASIQTAFQQESRKMQLKKQSFQLIQRLQENKQLLQQQIELYKEQHKVALQSQVNQWIHNQKQEISVAPGVIELFLQSPTPIAVQSVLDQALQLALYTQIDQHSPITLQEEHIELQATAIKSQLSNRLYTRAELLLDKYETSAQRINLKKAVITGRTLAEHLEPPVSPPAITDAIKKNRKAIAQAMQQYPDRWPLIRNYLKPLKDLDFQLNLKTL